MRRISDHFFFMAKTVARDVSRLGRNYCLASASMNMTGWERVTQLVDSLKGASLLAVK
jgi:hypothetical protein